MNDNCVRENLHASIDLLAKLAEGELSGQELGWRTTEDLEAEFCC
jgi:hypothetical protein